MRLHIANGRLIDPARGIDGRHDLYLSDGRVAAVGAPPPGFRADRVLDAAGLAVLPGLIDLGARAARPGAEAPALDAHALAAALAGGVTTLVLPVAPQAPLDDPAKVRALAAQNAPGQPRVLFLGALTLGLRGDMLAELGLLAEAGCVAFSQGEEGMADTRVLWGAMRYAAGLGLTLWLRPQDPWLARGACMAAGPYADRLGLSGLPEQAETIAVHTILELQRATGARVHLARLSSAAGLALARAARAEGLPLTCDVAARALHYTDLDVGFFDTGFRVQPPLRGQRDREAIRRALAEGVADAACSDHTQLPRTGKDAPFPDAAPGTPGLELLLSFVLKWARDAGVPLVQALARLTSAPAAVLRAAAPAQAPAGSLGEGDPADLCLVDLDAEWMAPGGPQAGSEAGPFAGMMLPGRVRATVVGGRMAWETPA